MTKRNQNQIVLRIFAPAVMLAAGACYDVNPINQPPTAAITVTANGAPVVANSPIPFMDQPVTITLDGTQSKDMDGHIVSYVWRRTDVSAAARFGLTSAGSGGMTASGAGGMMAAGSGGMTGSGGMGVGDEDGGVEGTGGMMAMMPMTPAMPMAPAAAPFAPGDDPQPVASPQVTLPAKGKYRFSLWVKDNAGAISAPASFVVKLGGFSPDAMCSAAYMQPNVDCHDCTCTPNAMGGCLDEAKACLQNPDPEFKMLCTAVVNCAVAKKCTGMACFAPTTCMNELTAAGSYMGGSAASCADASMAATNPCAAAVAIASCQMKPMCSDVCK
jgi:hypothetical protein